MQEKISPTRQSRWNRQCDTGSFCMKKRLVGHLCKEWSANKKKTNKIVPG